MSQRHSEYERMPDEWYPTPAWVTHTIIPWLERRAKYVWEPAPGKQHMATALRNYGFSVSVSKGDFLQISKPPNDRVTAICTNPPYGVGGQLAVKFIEHALDFNNIDTVCMLLRVDFDSGKTRQHLFGANHVWAHKLILLDRIKWFPGEAGPSTNHAWYCFHKKHRGPATIGYIGKP